MRKALLPGLILYSLLSGLGLFLSSGLSSPFLIPWLSGYLFLIFTASYFSLFSNERPNISFYIVVGIIGLNFLVQATGGVQSYLRPGYFLLASAGAVFCPPAHAYAAAGLILCIDAANLIFSSQETAGRLPAYAGFAVALAGVVFITSPIIGRIRSHSRIARERYKRLLADANAVDPLARGTKVNALSERQRQAANVSAAVEREGAFKGLIDMISGIVPAHTYALFLSDREDGVFTLRAIRSESRALGMVGTVQVLRGSGLIGICADKKQSQYLPDMVIPTKSLGYYTQDAPVKSFFALPIAEEDKSLGVLVVDSLERDAFSLDMRDMLGRFAPFFSTIIEKIRISQEQELRAKNFEALHEMSAVLSSSLELGEVLDKLAGEIKSVVPYDFCAFTLYDEKSDEAVIAALRGYESSLSGARFPVSESAILSQMLNQWLDRKASEAYHFPDLGNRGREIGLFRLKELQRPIQSLSCWPLVARERFIGGFFISTIRPNAFSDYHKRFIDTLMNQVSVVSDNTMLHRRIRDMARTDGLTGLLNHRTFMEKMKEEFMRLDRDVRPSFSLLLVDIDHFKKVNDTYGHPAGDVVLARTAEALREIARGADFVARYGGEEFAIGMVGADSRGAAQMAERIRKIVEKTTVAVDSRTEIRVTLSIGVASYPEDGSKVGALIAAADAALYHAKRTDRNRVCLHKDIKDEKNAKSQEPRLK